MWSDDEKTRIIEAFKLCGSDPVAAGSMAVELVAARGGHAEDVTTLKARVAVLETERDTLRAELAEARAAIARLTAAGQVLSEHADRTVGQCANPDPTTGPTCAERGCEKQACQYPKVKPVVPCIYGAEFHHTFGCPDARKP